MTWSTVEKLSTLTLSNSNKTVTGSGSGNERAMGDTYHWTGKYYCEIQGWTNSSNGGIGLSTGLTPLDGSGFNYDYCLDSGGNPHVQFDGSGSFTALGNPSGHTVCIAIDFDNDKIWFRLDGGSWNGSGTADPATGAGGYRITGKPALAPMIWFQSSAAHAILATTGADYLQTKPSGYSDWDTAEATTNVKLLGSDSARAIGVTSDSSLGYRGKTNDIAVIVVVSQNNSLTSNDVSSITDAGSLTWSLYQKFQFVNGANNDKMNIEVWWAALTSNVTTKKAITVHWASAINSATYCLMTFRGVGSTSSPFDNFGTNSNTASSTPSVTITTSGAACAMGFYASMAANFAGSAGGGASGSPFFMFNNNNSGSKPAYIWGLYQEPQPTTSETNHTIAMPSAETDWGMLAFSMVPTIAGAHGTFNTTETTDKFAAVGIPPTAGTFNTTEAPDVWSTTSGFTRLEVYKSGSVGNAGLTITTEHPDTIIFVQTVAVAVGGSVGSATVSSPNLTWNRRDVTRTGPGDDFENQLMEVWWAYAHDIVTSESVTISTSGSATNQVSTYVMVKGLNGNYEDPFDEKTRRSWGLNAGGFAGTDTEMQALQNYATGPQGGSAGDFTTMSTAIGNTALNTHNLGVTSTGAIGTPGNYAIGVADDQLNTGRYYFEFTATNPSGSTYAGGIVASFEVLEGDGASVSAGALLNLAGQIIQFGSVSGTLDVGISTNDIIAIAVDVDHSLIWFRNTTSGNGLWNGSAQADPALGTGGIFFGLSSPSTDNGLQHFNVGGSDNLPITILPFTIVTTSGTSQLWNFGASTFHGTEPDGFFSGWPSAATTGGTHQPWQHLTLLWAGGTGRSAFETLDPWPGFQTIVTQEWTVNRDLTAAVMAVYGDQSVLNSDNVRFDFGATRHEWQIAYETLIPGTQDPGSFESTDTADSLSGHGFGSGGSGVFGDLAATGTPDTFAATGNVTAVGNWISFETPDKFSAFIRQPLTGVWNSTEAPDHFAGTGIGLGEDGVLITTETPDTFAATGTVPIIGTWESTENADRFRAFAPGAEPIKRRRIFFVS